MGSSIPWPSIVVLVKFVIIWGGCVSAIRVPYSDVQSVLYLFSYR